MCCIQEGAGIVSEDECTYQRQCRSSVRISQSLKIQFETILSISFTVFCCVKE